MDSDDKKTPEAVAAPAPDATKGVLPPLPIKKKPSNAPKVKVFSMALTEPEEEALAIIKNTPPFTDLNMDRRRLIRYAIVSTAKHMQEGGTLPATASDMQTLQNTIAGLTAVVGASLQAASEDVTPAKRGRKPKETAQASEVAAPAVVVDPLAKGQQVCQALGGRVAGGTCYYTKYEVAGSGRAISFEVGVPLTSLTDGEIKKQYSPSREEWQSAKDWQD